MRRKVAAAGGLQPAYAYTTCSPGDNRPDCSGVAFGRDELEAKPVVAVPALVAEQQGRLPVAGDQDILIAIVIEITDSHSSP